MDVNNIQFTKIEIQITIYIFKHYKDKYNARQIARLLDLNHAHINKLCNSLTIKKLLIKEEIGNTICYSFNYKNELAIKFIEYILSLERIPKWLNVLKHNLEKFNSFIKIGCIFGSSIKSDIYNDIDVLLVYDKKHIKDVNKIKNEIIRTRLVEKPIRYVEITEKDIIKNKDDKIFYNIISENIIFYNSTKYIEVIKCLK